MTEGSVLLKRRRDFRCLGLGFSVVELALRWKSTQMFSLHIAARYRRFC